MNKQLNMNHFSQVHPQFEIGNHDRLIEVFRAVNVYRSIAHSKHLIPLKLQVYH